MTPYIAPGLPHRELNEYLESQGIYSFREPDKNADIGPVSSQEEYIVNTVFTIVATYYCVEYSALTIACRKSKYVLARRMAATILYHEYGMPFDRIGYHMNRCHTTICNMVRVWKHSTFQWCNHQTCYNTLVANCRKALTNPNNTR